jgi:flavodoxin
MMNVLIIYDSFFGNTEQIALAIGSALDSQGNVETIRVNEVKMEKLTGLDSLIVGSPTRGFKPTEAIAKFLKRISQNGLNGIRVTAFETRISLIGIESTALRTLGKIGGYAARSIARRLKKRGGNLAISPEGFLVTGKEGPLKEGELKRAAEWAKGIMKPH